MSCQLICGSRSVQVDFNIKSQYLLSSIMVLAIGTTNSELVPLEDLYKSISAGQTDDDNDNDDYKSSDDDNDKNDDSDDGVGSVLTCNCMQSSVTLSSAVNIVPANILTLAAAHPTYRARHNYILIYHHPVTPT